MIINVQIYTDIIFSKQSRGSLLTLRIFLALLVTSRNFPVEPWDTAGFYTKLLTDTSPNILIIFEILLQNMPRFYTFLITSCGNEGSDDLGRDFMTENQIL